MHMCIFSYSQTLDRWWGKDNERDDAGVQFSIQGGEKKEEGLQFIQNVVF